MRRPRGPVYPLFILVLTALVWSCAGQGEVLSWAQEVPVTDAPAATEGDGSGDATDDSPGDTTDDSPGAGDLDSPSQTDPVDFEPPDTSETFFRLFEPDGNGWIQFAVNDPREVNPTSGSAWWWADEDATVTSADLTAEVDLVRVAGSPTYWYGAVLAPGDSRNLNGFLAVTIHTQGRCAVYQYSESGWGIFKTVEWHTVVDPQDSGHINQGFKVINTIRATYVDGVLRIGFNDGPAEIQLENVGNFSAGVAAGVYAGVSPAEAQQFPETPVDVRYRINLPYAAP